MSLQPMKQHSRSFIKLTNVTFKYSKARCDISSVIIYIMETDISLFYNIAREIAYSCTLTDKNPKLYM